MESTSVKLPVALDAESLFPHLDRLRGSNIPLCAPAELIQKFPPLSNGQPVSIHPMLDNPAHSGDCVMAANWHTAFSNPRNYVDWLIGLKEKTPVDTAWYAPASALPSNLHILCYSGFDLFDFRAVDLRTAQRRFCTPEGDFPAEMLNKGICGCEGCRSSNLKMHNREALLKEIALVTLFIEGSQIRDLVESRCRFDATQVAIMRHLDSHYVFMEQRLPVARSGVMRANSEEALQRAEVRRFAERVVTRYIPPKTDVAVLLPCSAKKPYSLSRSHRRFQQAIAGRAHELIVTSPLGLVPRELECVYPAGHYDVPVTGFWDAEEWQSLRESWSATLIAQVRGSSRISMAVHSGVAQMAADMCGIT
jgi:archaeosine synthase